MAHDGALLMTEDGNGTIWRIAYTRPNLTASIGEEGGHKHLVVTVTRAAAAPDVKYTLEVSSDLVTWIPALAEIVTVTDTPTQLVVRDNTPIQDLTARFIRVRVSPR